MLKKLLVLILSLVLSASVLLAAEGLSRRQWQRQLLSRPPVYQADPILGFRLKDNYQGIHQALGTNQPITITTTSQGFRDHQIYTYAKPANTFRILVLGDSFVEGDEVNLPQIFTKQLERQLNLRQNGVTFEVINAGWRGSSTLQQYLWLKNEGLKFNPDLIILNFSIGNDITEADLFDIQFDAQGLAEKLTLKNTYVDSQGFLQSTHSGLCDQSYFCRLYLRPLRQRPQSDFSKPLWQLTQAHLLAIRDLAQTHGSRFMLTITPAIKPDLFTHQQLIDFATSSDIAFVDLWPQFSQRADRQLYFKADPHWTAAGHELASQVIADTVYPPASFLVAGHAYGSPSGINLGLYPKFLSRLQQSLISETKFLVLTGDIIRDIRHPESWQQVQHELDQLGLTSYFVTGNHGYDRFSRDLFTEKYGNTYYNFDYQDNRFIILDTQKQAYSVSPDQVEFLSQSLRGNFRRVFIFWHELLWNSRQEYSYISANTNSRYSNVSLRQSNFWDQVYPLLQRHSDKQIFVFAGDLGGRPDSIPAFYQNLGHITLIASGMGAIQDENYLQVSLNQDQVKFELIPLNLTNTLRPLEYYTPQHLSPKITDFIYDALGLFRNLLRRPN